MDKQTITAITKNPKQQQKINSIPRHPAMFFVS